MKKFFIILSLWLIPLVAVGSTLEPSVLTPKKTEESFKITGIVVDAVSQQPLAGVNVTLGSYPGASCLTLGNGSYSITNIPSGAYTLNFTKDGYKSREDLQIVNKALNLNVMLTPLIVSPPPPSAATITGKVTDAKTGSVVAGAIITLENLTFTTGSNGIYSFTIKIGSYKIFASTMGYETKVATIDANEAKTYTVEFSLVPVPPPLPGNATITGKVIDEKTGLPITNATVRLNSYQITTNSSGSYSQDVAEGNYTLIVSMNGYQIKTVSVNATEAKKYTVDVSLTPIPLPPPPPPPSGNPPTITFTAETISGIGRGQTMSYVPLIGTTGRSVITVVAKKADGTPAAGITVSFNVTKQFDIFNTLKVSFDGKTAVTNSAGQALVTTVTNSAGQANATLICTAQSWSIHILSLTITATATIQGMAVQYYDYVNVCPPCSQCHAR